MKTRFLLAAALFIASPALALDLQAARAQKLVAETPEGYIKAVKSSGEVEALVSDVNAKRRAEYERIGREKGQSPELVGKLAAPEIAKNLAK